MATVPSPRTWAVGELLTAAKLNTDLRDGLNFLLAPPLAVLVKNAAQNISNNTLTAVTWETEQLDRDAGHSTVSNTSRYTCQTAGWYQLTGSVRWGNLITSGELRYQRFRKNGTTLLPGSTQATPSAGGSGTAYTAAVVTSHAQLAVGDYVELMVNQSSGGTMQVLDVFDSATDTQLAVRWIST